MNIVFLSPHFPPNFYNFCVRLRELGANVLGIADAPYEHLRPELRGVLTEYYRVADMNDYDQLLRACGYFTHRYGKLDRFESHNEYWLETEAQIRTDFNIRGFKTNWVANITRKSKMKKLFQKTGVAVAQGKVVKSIKSARAFIAKIGYPVVAKPDRGIGAANTYCIKNDEELEKFFAEKPAVDYIMEEFIAGTIYSFDGMADREGNAAFYTSHVFSQGIMETVNEDRDLFYYSLRELPVDLEKAGCAAVRVFDIRERFFHIEFFRTPDDELFGLEVNIRPPGGLTMDMFNYANDVDMYREWANVVVNGEFSATYSRPYHCGYVGRKFGKKYAHSQDEIMRDYGQQVVHHERIESIFRDAIGDYGYLVRSSELDEVLDAARFIQETVKSKT